MKKVLKVLGIILLSFIGLIILVGIFVFETTPDQEVVNHPRPTVSQEWIDDAAQRYFTSHQGMFNNLTLDLAKNNMKACANEFTDLQRCEDIIEQSFWLGMPQDWIIASIGNPNDINTTVVNGLTSEQWVYGNPIYGATYIYLDNGILTSYQKN